MIEGASDEKLNQLKDDLQRARTEKEMQRTIRKAEFDADRQARDEAARGRHDDMMNQLRTMRELLHEQRESQMQQVEQMERRHAERVRRHETMLGQLSDVQATVASFRDERRAHSAQCVEEHARAKAGGYLAGSVSDVRLHSDELFFWFWAKDAEAVKQVLESVAETRDELHSVADGMGFPYRLIEWSLIIRVNRATGRLDSPPRRITTYLVGECVRAGEYVLGRWCLRGC
jgi:hypothetical protein